SILLRHTLSASRVLAAAAAVVVLADPWAPLATGFWLSFLAVAILFAAGAAGSNAFGAISAARVRGATVDVADESANQPNTIASRANQHWQRAKQVCVEAIRLQWLITIAMLPVLAFLFQQVSLVSPLANALAIPVLTFVVTPLALALAVFGLVPGLGWLATASGVLAHFALEYTLIPVTWLANLSWAAFDVAAAPFWTLPLAGVGLCWALQPPGWPMRWAGWCLLVPVLSFEPQRPAFGHWRLLAFDVGQGGAVLLQTQTHDVLFDTGPRQGTSDAGVRTILPALRALGVRKLDGLVVSHADSDHAGGLLAVLKVMPVGTLYTSFSMQDWLGRSSPTMTQLVPTKGPARVQLCERGQRWVWEGVVFEFLHPEARYLGEVALTTKSAPLRSAKGKSSKNAQSCVLHAQGSHHSAMLPGDIGVKQEQLLLEHYASEQNSSGWSASVNTGVVDTIAVSPKALTADLVVVAHHGSDTSSSLRFVQQLRAQHAIVQAGYLNRFGHPHQAIKQRWLDAQAEFWQTDRHGAIEAASTPQGLDVQAYSQLRKRYWHQRSR
ncbi:MAG: ComEC/Rec2 family competence protein, partial [Alcaligenaceae bacterium]